MCHSYIEIIIELSLFYSPIKLVFQHTGKICTMEKSIKHTKYMLRIKIEIKTTHINQG